MKVKINFNMPGQVSGDMEVEYSVEEFLQASKNASELMNGIGQHGPKFVREMGAAVYEVECLFDQKPLNIIKNEVVKIRGDFESIKKDQKQYQGAMEELQFENETLKQQNAILISTVKK